MKLAPLICDYCKLDIAAGACGGCTLTREQLDSAKKEEDQLRADLAVLTAINKRSGEILKIMNMRVSRKAQEQLKARLEQIALEYEDQARADAHLPLEERPPLSVCIAVRTWVPKFMRDLYRLELRANPGKNPEISAHKQTQKQSSKPTKRSANPD